MPGCWQDYPFCRKLCNTRLVVLPPLSLPARAQGLESSGAAPSPWHRVQWESRPRDELFSGPGLKTEWDAPSLSSCLCPISLGLLWGDLGRCPELLGDTPPAASATWAASGVGGRVGSAANSPGSRAASLSPGSSCPASSAQGKGGNLRDQKSVPGLTSLSRMHSPCPVSPSCHSGGCQPLLCPCVCPERKWLKRPDFLTVMLEGKVTCRSDWREGDPQNCFARHVLVSGKS